MIAPSPGSSSDQVSVVEEGRAPRLGEVSGGEGGRNIRRASILARALATAVCAVCTTGIGVWAASRTTHQANVNVEDTRHGIPVGRLLVMPLVY